MTAVESSIIAARRVPLWVAVAIAMAWTAAIAAHAAGAAHFIDHDAILGGGHRITIGALALFSGAWIAMVAAMMLPSAVPMIRLFAGASAGQAHGGAVVVAFVSGYLAVWTTFGWLALAFDATVHRGVDAWPWLDEHPWFVAASVLALAGLFQRSALKDACLRTCRHPAAYLIAKYRRGIPAAFRIGWSHGLFCVGCCWALMLVAFALGMTDLRLMAAFTALMAYEKIGRYGATVARVSGAALIVLAALVVIHPFNDSHSHHHELNHAPPHVSDVDHRLSHSHGD